MRLSLKTIQNTPWYLKPFFWNQKRKYGGALQSAKVWAVIPRLFLSVASVYGVLSRRKSLISPQLRSLISVHVAQRQGCRFCIDLNSFLFLKNSDDVEKLQSLKNWQASERFNELEKSALHYAELVTDAAKMVDESSFQALKMHFSEKEIIELTALIVFQNMSSQFNRALDIEPQGLCLKWQKPRR